MTKKPALGRGLAALLPENGFETQPGERVRMVDCELIHANPNQPRKLFDEQKLAELAESLKSYGVMQPLIVVEHGDGYMIAAGERRYRAAELADIRQLPVIIRQLDEKQLAELSLIENIQREDLSPLEEAAAYQSLIDTHGYTQEELSTVLGKSRSHIANTLRLLRLPAQDRRLLAEGKLSPGHARAVLSIPDPLERAKLVRKIVRNDLSVRQTEDLALKMKPVQPLSMPKPRQRELIYGELAHQLGNHLGVRAQITGTESRGRVVLEYASEDDLQNIIDAILGS